MRTDDSQFSEFRDDLHFSMAMDAGCECLGRELVTRTGDVTHCLVGTGLSYSPFNEPLRPRSRRQFAVRRFARVEWLVFSRSQAYLARREVVMARSKAMDLHHPLPTRYRV